MNETELTRALSVGEAVSVGGLLLACAQLVVDIWRARQDRALLVLQPSEKSETGKLAQAATAGRGAGKTRRQG
jgi:hypothetical protein